MNKHTKIAICILAIFVVAMMLSLAVAQPVEAKKFKNNNTITVSVKDGNKIVNVNCSYNESYDQYLGHVDKYGKRYSVAIIFEKDDKMQHRKMGWWTSATNAGMSDDAKVGYGHNYFLPVTSLELS